MRDLILRTIAGYLLPMITVYGGYIITNGHLTPGGGFAGGTIIAAGLILAALTWGTRQVEETLHENTLNSMDTLGVCAFVTIGSWATLRGAAYLTNLAAGFPPGTPGTMLSAGAVWPLGAAIGLKVATTLYGLFVRVTGKAGEVPPS